MELNSTKIRKSRYCSGGTSEVSEGLIEWWERNIYEVTPGDTLYRVDSKTAHKIHIIADIFLNDQSLWWVIAQYNNILDPWGEIVEGAQIAIPSLEKVETMLAGRPGGVPSTRIPQTTIRPII
ncbi:hypothetical protein [Janthinobacterium sp.]|uniref:hypothetical protein n=1 Tax=Janthinobacterium sp. TaxID=1871054 RepID=UPI002606919F|nr:hypothetical protein [Janthinobacterium sp.]